MRICQARRLPIPPIKITSAEKIIPTFMRRDLFPQEEMEGSCADIEEAASDDSPCERVEATGARVSTAFFSKFG
jgi:hypothetical protein